MFTAVSQLLGEEKTFRLDGRWPAGLFKDPAVRSGIKFALSGILAFFFALLFRLDKPEWAVTTAFVLSTPKFVGAIGEKTVLRIGGAMAGAVLGYLITASLQQNPLLFLGAMGLLVSIGTAMYGGTFIPYGFRQCGYTATLVATQGLSNPAASWHVGLWRCEEICLGILVTMVVTTTVWPRYARKEFGDEVRGTLAVLEKLFRGRAEAFLSGAGDFLPDVLSTVGIRLAKLRKMIRLGCMESSAFRHRRTQVDAVVAQLGVLSSALSNFGRTLPSKSRFRDYIEAEARALHESLAGGIGVLADPAATEGIRRARIHHAEECLGKYRERLVAFRLDGVGDSVSVDDSLEHAGYSLSISEIFEALSRLEVLLPEVEAGQTESFPMIRFEKMTLPSPGWIKSGIRGGLAVVAGLFLLDWLKPPGGELIVVGTYLFTGFSLEASDRKGDVGVFQTLVASVVICIAYFFFLLLMAPLMSSYSVMNLFLGVMLFCTGYLLEAGKLGSFGTLFALLMTVILVGLNAQKSVGFEAIVGPVLGLAMASVLSALLRRLIWPVLPQDALRARLGELLGLLEKTARHPEVSVPVPERAKIALSSADAIVLVDVLEECRVVQEGEAERLRSYIRWLARLGGSLMFSTGPVDLPPEALAIYVEERKLLLASIADQLRVQRNAVEKQAAIPRGTEIRDVRTWTTRCRMMIRQAKGEVLRTIAALGLLYRHEQAALSAAAASRMASQLHPADDFSDHIL